MRVRALTLGALVAAGLTMSACGSSSSTKAADTSAAKTTATTVAAGTTGTTAAAMADEKDIVDTAVAAGSFKTLATLLTQAGLVDTLKGAGPFTVFAPTDDAFAKVDAATLAKLAANPAALKQVLTYHVLAGKVMAADVKAGTAKTVEGSEVTITVAAGKVMVDKATVTKPDIMAKNGVIHAIDTVLLPADLKL